MSKTKTIPVDKVATVLFDLPVSFAAYFDLDESEVTEYLNGVCEDVIGDSDDESSESEDPSEEELTKDQIYNWCQPPTQGGLKLPDLRQRAKSLGLKVTAKTKREDIKDLLLAYWRKGQSKKGIWRITIKTLMGSFFDISIDKTSTVLQLKEAVAARQDIELKQVKLHHLRYGASTKMGDINFPDGTVGLVLDDKKGLEEQGVCDESFFQLHISFLR